MKKNNYLMTGKNARRTGECVYTEGDFFQISALQHYMCICPRQHRFTDVEHEWKKTGASVVTDLPASSPCVWRFGQASSDQFLLHREN